jgi:hypothetical protein
VGNTQSDIIIKFLGDYGFDRPSSCRARIQSAKEDKLEGFLEDYRSLYDGFGGSVLVGEARPGVTVWPDQTGAIDPVGIMSQWALWADAIYVADPVLAVGPRDLFISLAAESQGWRGAVEDAAMELHSLLVLARLGYVELTGLPLMRQPALRVTGGDPPVEPFERKLVEVALDELRVLPGVGRSELGIALGESRSVRNPPESTDVLYFEFEGDHDGQMFAYARILRVEPDTRKVTSHARLSGEAIAEDQFDAWYRQCVRKVMRSRFRNLALELGTAGELAASFATTSKTNMRLAVAMDATVSEDSGFEGVARLVLPWRGNLSVEQMIRMRSDTRGLVELRELVRRVALHVRGDAQSITQNELANAQRELDEEIVPEIKAEVRKSRRAVIKNVVVVPAVTLIGQVAFGWPAALAAGATALVGAAINLPETLEVKGKRGLALYSTLVAGDKSGR